MKRRTAFLLLSTSFLALASCGKKGAGDRAGADGGSNIIGVSCRASATPFSKAIHESMKMEAAERGYEVVFLGCENDLSKQQKQIKDFVVREVAAIALNPATSEAISSSVKEANAAGIPVFTFGEKIQSSGTEIASHIGTDYAQGGKLAAKAMIEALGVSGGKTLVLDHRAMAPANELVSGFKKTIDAHNASVNFSAQIEIVAELPGSGDHANSLRATEDALQSEPGLNGIFAINDSSALGAVEALKNVDKLKQVAVVSFGGTPNGIQAIETGEIDASAIQHPDQIGRETVRAIIAHLSGEKVEPSVTIPTSPYKKGGGKK